MYSLHFFESDFTLFEWIFNRREGNFHSLGRNFGEINQINAKVLFDSNKSLVVFKILLSQVIFILFNLIFLYIQEFFFVIE